ncbi:Fe-S-containing protein [Haemophilus parahaemolyticus]
MTYFFIFLLQSLLPISLLLGASWAIKKSTISPKTLIWLSLFGLAFGVVLRLNLPNGQVPNLILILGFLIAFFLFAISQGVQSTKITAFWQFILMLIAGATWANDPNITALTNIDVINTDFILNLSAVVFGIIFCFAASAWLYFLLKQQQKTQGKSTALFALGFLLFIALVVPLMGELLLTLMKLQLIELTKTRLSFVAKSGKITVWLNAICVVLMAIILAIFTIQTYVKRLKHANTESDPIEKRKKLALVQISKRLIGWGIFGILWMSASQLYWEKVASQPPQLSEAVPVQLNEKDEVHLALEPLKDGKLHRFVWIADDGKAVRFFIINRQPSKVSMAAVFDACLLCGDQGYVMQGNQVVCVGCGVHMFIPSIGKPGGCNPVPIEDWLQTDNEIIISRKSLEDGLNLFSTIVEIDVQDPISGAKLKNTKTEFKYSHEGHTYFFENEKNLDQFRDNPEKYLGNKESESKGE